MQRRRDAFTVLEVTVAMALLVVVLGTLAHLVVGLDARVRTDRQWEAVGQILDAGMESLVAGGYDSLRPGRASVPLPAEWRQRVAGLQLKATVWPAGRNLKTVVLRATWPAPAGGRALQAELRAQVAPRRLGQGGSP